MIITPDHLRILNLPAVGPLDPFNVMDLAIYTAWSAEDYLPSLAARPEPRRGRDARPWAVADLATKGLVRLLTADGVHSDLPADALAAAAQARLSRLLHILESFRRSADALEPVVIPLRDDGYTWQRANDRNARRRTDANLRALCVAVDRLTSWPLYRLRALRDADAKVFTWRVALAATLDDLRRSRRARATLAAALRPLLPAAPVDDVAEARAWLLAAVAPASWTPWPTLRTAYRNAGSPGGLRADGTGPNTLRGLTDALGWRQATRKGTRGVVATPAP